MIETSANCPRPAPPASIQLAHGGGGRLMRKLLEEIFWKELGESPDSLRHDGVVLTSGQGRPVMTTDGFVVKPPFFPGGDIGRLAVFGTVNDLAMCGAVPAYLSASFILEEGLSLDDLRRIVASMRSAADLSGVRIVTGDTKVVERGHGDAIFISTTGLGWVADGIQIGPRYAAPGDVIFVSGDIGRHGVAVLAVREGLTFSGQIESDCAELARPVKALLDTGATVHCLRDLTRGGLLAALWEIAHDGTLDLEVEETRIPVSPGVRGAAELLGLDPLLLPCEGRFVGFVPETDARRALDAVQATGHSPTVIGRVAARSQGRPGRVVLRTALGTERELDLPLGEQLPRIC